MALIQCRVTPSHENPGTINLLSFLPTKLEAVSFLEYYHQHFDYLYHLVILHQTKRDIDTMYDSIAHKEPVRLQHMALLFSIMSVALFFQLLSTESADVAEVCGRETVFLAGAALIQNNHAAFPTVEGLQASMIIGHHISSLTIPPSVSFLFFQGALIAQAKSLGLHNMDNPRSNDGCKVAEFDRTELELRRRLWWDLASYDW